MSETDLVEDACESAVGDDGGAGSTVAPTRFWQRSVRLGVVLPLLAVTALLAAGVGWQARGDAPGQGDEADDSSAPSAAAPTTTLPPRSAYPSASSTGVEPGVELVPSDSIVVATPGTIIEGLDITGTVRITASDVTLRQSRVTGSDYWLILIEPDLTGVVIEDVEVDGNGPRGAEGSVGIAGPATVRRTNIHGVENGIVPGSGSIVEDNYIHGLEAPGDPHYDGIQIDGGVSDVVIEGNAIDLAEHDQTAAVMINNYFGPVDDVLVQANWLVGGGYTLYSDAQFDGGPIDGVEFIDNRLIGGAWGYASITDSHPGWAGNTDGVTDRVLDAPYPE